jgi:hypothetical protein
MVNDNSFIVDNNSVIVDNNSFIVDRNLVIAAAAVGYAALHLRLIKCCPCGTWRASPARAILY